MMKSVELVFDSVRESVVGDGGVAAPAGSAGLSSLGAPAGRGSWLAFREGGFEFTGDEGGDGFLAGGDNLAGDGVGLGELQGHRGEFAG